MKKNYYFATLLMILGLVSIGCSASKENTAAGTFFEGAKTILDNPIVTGITAAIPGSGWILGGLSGTLGLLAANERRKVISKNVAIDDIVAATDELKLHVTNQQNLQEWKNTNKAYYSKATLKEVDQRRLRQHKKFTNIIGEATQTTPHKDSTPTTAGTTTSIKS